MFGRQLNATLNLDLTTELRSHAADRFAPGYAIGLRLPREALFRYGLEWRQDFSERTRSVLFPQIWLSLPHDATFQARRRLRRRCCRLGASLSGRLRDRVLTGVPETSVRWYHQASTNLFLAQRFARHVSPLTTSVYTHPSDEELFNRVRGLRC